MGNLSFVIGGARSGKSNFAQDKLKKYDKVLYLATAIAFDDSMTERIRRHRLDRPENWETLEKYKDFKSLSEDESFNKHENILLDCLTLLISNQMLEADINWNEPEPKQVNELEKNILEDIKNFLDLCKDKNLVIVSNEVGMSVVPDNYISSYFRDIAGRINQYVAKEADEVNLLMSGIPLKLK